MDFKELEGIMVFQYSEDFMDFQESNNMDFKGTDYIMDCYYLEDIMNFQDLEDIMDIK